MAPVDPVVLSRALEELLALGGEEADSKSECASDRSEGDGEICGGFGSWDVRSEDGDTGEPLDLDELMASDAADNLEGTSNPSVFAGDFDGTADAHESPDSLDGSENANSEDLEGPGIRSLHGVMSTLESEDAGNSEMFEPDSASDVTFEKPSKAFAAEASTATVQKLDAPGSMDPYKGDTRYTARYEYLPYGSDRWAEQSKGNKGLESKSQPWEQPSEEVTKGKSEAWSDFSSWDELERSCRLLDADGEGKILGMDLTHLLDSPDEACGTPGIVRVSTSGGSSSFCSTPKEIPRVKSVDSSNRCLGWPAGAASMLGARVRALARHKELARVQCMDSPGSPSTGCASPRNSPCAISPQHKHAGRLSSGSPGGVSSGYNSPGPVYLYGSPLHRSHLVRGMATGLPAYVSTKPSSVSNANHLTPPSKFT